MILDLLREGVVLGDGGAIFELERRGYVSAGPFTPEACLDEPWAVKAMQTDFARAGAEVLQAVTYYAHEEKLKAVGREGLLGEINAAAVEIAGEVARDYGCLVAGNLANTWVFKPGDLNSHVKTRRQFDRQIECQKGVDFFIAETIEYLGEALIALEAIQASGLPAMITLGFKYSEKTLDGVVIEEAFKRLEDAGADIVGLNCFNDPPRMLPLAARVLRTVNCFVATQPVGYGCIDDRPYFQIQEIDGHVAFPLELDPFTLTRFQMADYAVRARELGVRYIGGCCGVSAHHIRAMAEALGRTVAASKYSPRLEMHSIIGDPEHRRATDERTLCQQRYGVAACHFLLKDQK